MIVYLELRRKIIASKNACFIRNPRVITFRNRSMHGSGRDYPSGKLFMIQRTYLKFEMKKRLKKSAYSRRNTNFWWWFK